MGCLTPAERSCNVTPGRQASPTTAEVTGVSRVTHRSLHNLTPIYHTISEAESKFIFLFWGKRKKKPKSHKLSPPQEPVCSCRQGRSRAQGRGFAPRVFHLPLSPCAVAPPAGWGPGRSGSPGLAPLPRSLPEVLLLPVPHPHSLNTRGTKALRDPAGTFQTRHRCDGLGDGEHLRRGTPKPCRTSPGTTEAGKEGGKGGLPGLPAPQDSTPRTHLPQACRDSGGRGARSWHGPPPPRPATTSTPLKAPVLLSHAAHPAPPASHPLLGASGHPGQGHRDPAEVSVAPERRGYRAPPPLGGAGGEAAPGPRREQS